MVENPGERMFKEYAAQEGHSEPRQIETGPEQTPDFELTTPAGPVICEVKHFSLTQKDREQLEKMAHVGLGQPGFQRLRDRILDEMDSLAGPHPKPRAESLRGGAL